MHGRHRASHVFSITDPYYGVPTNTWPEPRITPNAPLSPVWNILCVNFNQNIFFVVTLMGRHLPLSCLKVRDELMRFLELCA